MCPELNVQIWMSSKRSASMIIGNIDGSGDLSDSWTGFTQFTPLEENPPNGYMWSGVRLTRKRLTSRPDHLWPALWEKMGKNAKLKDQQKWSHEKPHHDNARKLRGIYFIDPEDKEFKETIKNARKKLETPMAPAMPCKIGKNNKKCGNGESNKVKSKLACIMEASESTRIRIGESLPTHHGDHIAGKGDNSLQHYKLVHKFIPMLQAMKIPAASAAVDKEWEKLEKISAWNLKQERGDRWSKDEGRKSSFRLTDGHMSFEKCWIGSKAPKIQGSSCTPRRYCEWWFWIFLRCLQKKDHQHHKQQQKSWISSPDCWVAQDKQLTQLSAYTQVKNGGCSKIIENSKIGMSRHLDSSTTTQMA